MSAGLVNHSSIINLQSAFNWLLLRSGSGTSAWNMALDEALLEAMPHLGRPILRLYSWDVPAASFGYFQKYKEVERLTPLRPLVRRPTGGGVVPHAHDWTYSLAFPPGHEWYELTALESYRRIHQWLLESFARRNLQTLLAPMARIAQPGSCFAGYAQFDLLWGGQKIAGAAQRRKREGLLIQGSVQPGAMALSRTDWETALCEVAPEARWQAFEPGPELRERASDLAQKKYSQTSYNQKR